MRQFALLAAAIVVIAICGCIVQRPMPANCGRDCGPAGYCFAPLPGQMPANCGPRGCSIPQQSYPRFAEPQHPVIDPSGRMFLLPHSGLQHWVIDGAAPVRPGEPLQQPVQ